MDDSSDKGFTSSIPTRFHFSPKYGENNENGQIGSPKLLKSKKPVVKHFMSPTISAASKAAAVPPKKILGERNSPMGSGVSCCSVRSSCGSAEDTDSECNEQKNIDVVSAWKKPYDPLTNYLSPRPRFLRYNPNRKRKIFLHGESETSEIKAGAAVVSTSSSLESQKDDEEITSEEEGLVKEEMEKSERSHNADADEEDMEEEEEIEEFDEGKCWSLKGFLKFFLVLVSLFVFTTFIMSMNSSNPLLNQEASWEFGEQFLNQSKIHEVVAGKEYFTSEFEAMVGKGKESHIGLLLDVAQKHTDNEFVKAGISEDNEIDRGVLESNAGLSEGEQFEDVSNDEIEVSDQFQWSEATEGEDLTDLKVDDGQLKVSFNQPSSLKFGVDESVVDEGMEKIQEASGQLQVQGPETEENIESFQEDTISEKEAAVCLNARNEQMESEEEIKFQPEVFDQGMEKIQETSGQLQGTEAEENIESFQEDMIPEMETAVDLNARNEQMKSEEELKFQPEVILAISFTIVAVLGLIYHYPRQTSGKEDHLPAQDGKEDNLHTVMQLDTEPEEATKIQNRKVICSVDEEELRKVELLGSPSSPVHSHNVASEQFSKNSNAPIVELLGELVIGEEASSSFRSTKMRRKMLDPEQENSISTPATYKTISRSKVPLAQNQEKSLPLELPTADSPSHGSSTTEKKIVIKKEERKGGDVSIATLTPVRRSSRIRNRAMSP